MSHTSIIRSGRTAVAAGVVALLALTTLVTPASAQSFLDSADPCPPGVEVTPASFPDRDDILDAHVLNVDCGAELGVWQGDGSGMYQAAAATRRDQMATFIVQGLEAAGYDLPTPSDQGFTDIAGNVHQDNINILAEIGVTSGRTATSYEPGSAVRRDQMATFMLQAAEFAFEDQGGMTPSEPSPFEDVAASNVHADNIAAAHELLELTAGRTETTFAPQATTRRDQMATFIVRLIDVTLITNYS